MLKSAKSGHKRGDHCETSGFSDSLCASEKDNYPLFEGQAVVGSVDIRTQSNFQQNILFPSGNVYSLQLRDLSSELVTNPRKFL